MAVVVETTIGDFTIDLFIEERPRTCMNFLKLCKRKYYNLNLLYSVERNFVAQTGDPTGTGRGGDSIFKEMFGQQARLYEGEKLPVLRHTDLGTVSMVAYGDRMYGSQFFVTLGEDLRSLDSEHLVFGRVTEGLDVVAKLNDVLTDDKNRPYQDIRITHTVVLEDPFPDPDEVQFPEASPEPTAEMLASDYIAAHEDIEDTAGKDIKEIEEEIAEKEAQARATILEMVGDLPDADMAPPENVLFVCKLNPITTSEDLEIIFSRFGEIVCTEVIRDHVTGKSLQYAFIEFKEKKSCEDAYFKMDNVLIDDRRIHVDFSQSVSKVKWRGKGRGVMHFDDRGRRLDSRKDAPPRNQGPKLDEQGKPKSRFIDAAAYQKKYQQEQESKGHRRRDGERPGRDGLVHREDGGDYSRSGVRQLRHSDDRGNRHMDDRSDRHMDDRGNRHADDRGNRHMDDRSDRHADDRGNRHMDDRGNRHSVDRGNRHMEDRSNRHMEDRGNRHMEDRGNRHMDDRGNRHIDDRGNRHIDDRGNRHMDDRGNRHMDDRGNRHMDDRGNRHFRHVDDVDKRVAEQVQGERRHVSKRRSSSPSDEEQGKRRRLMGQLRADLKTDRLPLTSERRGARNDASDSSSPDRVKKVKKKKKKNKNKKKSKKAKYSSSESSDSDSDATPVKKKKKKNAKKKKRKSCSTSSSTSDSEKELRRNKKKIKRNR